MSGLVTKETNRSIKSFIDSFEQTSKQEDSKTLLNLFEEVTEVEPKMWGNAKVPDYIIEFGKYNYQRKNSKEIFEWFYVGFAPRKAKITIYFNSDMTGEETLLNQLGKCSWGKGCLYINKLADIDLDILKQLLKLAYTNMKAQ